MILLFRTPSSLHHSISLQLPIEDGDDDPGDDEDSESDQHPNPMMTHFVPFNVHQLASIENMHDHDHWRQYHDIDEDTRV